MALDPLTKEFAKKPLEFLRTHAINPAQDNAVLRRMKAIELNDRSSRFFSKRSQIDDALPLAQHKYVSATSETPVAWIKLRPDPVYGGVTFKAEFATDPLKDYLDRVEAADSVPVYFLPWEPDRMVRLSIPPYKIENVIENYGGAIDMDPYSPHLFFTAGLSGCSVFVYGDPRHPTITHAGTNTPTPYGDDCATFWRELLLLERFQRMQHEGIAHEVNLKDYMEKESPGLTAFWPWLSRQKSKFTVEHAVNFGAVFGIRYGALWTFYLQESGWFTRFEIVNDFIISKETRTATQIQKSPSGISFFDKKVPVEVKIEKRIPFPKKVVSYKTVPLRVRPIFPAASGSAELWETFQRTY